MLVHEDPLAPPLTETAGSDRVTAPVPGRVARVLVQPGDKVAKNAPLRGDRGHEDGVHPPGAGRRHGRYRSATRVDDMVEEGTELVTFKTETAAG